MDRGDISQNICLINLLFGLGLFVGSFIDFNIFLSELPGFMGLLLY